MVKNIKRKIGICVIVIISAAVLLIVSIYVTKNKSVVEETHSAVTIDFSGYIIKTDRAPFFVAENDSIMFSENELVRMQFEDADLSDEDYSTGDKIKISLQRVGDLKPPVAFVLGIERIESGNVDNIDTDVLNELENLGYDIV